MSTITKAQLVIAASISMVLAACATEPIDPAANSASPGLSASAVAPSFAGDPAEFTITSDDISADGKLSESIQGQAAITCSGPGESLHVSWNEPPAGTKSIALTFENLTVPFVYWARIDIDPAQGEILHDRYGASSGRELTNDIGFAYPIPPCPSDESPETYRLTVWALDTELGSGLRTYVDLHEALVGHELASATLDGEAIGTRQ